MPFYLCSAPTSSHRARLGPGGASGERRYKIKWPSLDRKEEEEENGDRHTSVCVCVGSNNPINSARERSASRGNLRALHSKRQQRDNGCGFFSFLLLLYDLYIYLESVVTLPISSEEALGVYYTTVYVIRITNAIVVDCWNNLLSGRDSVIGSAERHSFNELPLQTSHTLRRYEMSKRKASVSVCVCPVV